MRHGRRILLLVLVAAASALTVAALNHCLHDTRSVASPVARKQSAATTPHPNQGTDGASPSRAEEGKCVVEHASYTKSTEFDPGTLRVFVRNCRDNEVRLAAVLLDEVHLPTWGIDTTGANVGVNGVVKEDPTHNDGAGAAERFSGKRVIWAKVSSSTVPPGGVEQFSAKLTNALTRPCKIEIMMSNHEKIGAVMRPTPPPVTISAVNMPSDYRTISIYVEGQSDDPVQVDRVEVTGLLKPARTWLSSRTVVKGEKQLAVATPDSAVVPGTHLTVGVYGPSGCVAMTQVRAFGGYPLGVPGRAGAGGPNWNEQEYDYQPPYLTAPTPSSSASARPPSSGDYGNYVFMCAMHQYGCDLERSARETMRRDTLCQTLDPTHPTFIHMCRSRPETGYALFSGLTDVLRTNPSVSTGQSRGAKGEPPELTVERLTRYAYLSVRPQLLHCLLDTSTLGESQKVAGPAEVSRRGYTIVAGGAKGIFYRRASPGAEKATPQEMAIIQITNTVTALRDELAVADVVPWASSDRPTRVSSYALLAGGHAVLLFLVGHGPTRDAQGVSEADTTGENSDPLKVSLKIPPWLKVRDVAEVRGSTRTPVPHALGGDLSFTTVTPVTASVFYVSTERADR